MQSVCMHELHACMYTKNAVVSWKLNLEVHQMIVKGVFSRVFSVQQKNLTNLFPGSTLLSRWRLGAEKTLDRVNLSDASICFSKPVTELIYDSCLGQKLTWNDYCRLKVEL